MSANNQSLKLLAMYDRVGTSHPFEITGILQSKNGLGTDRRNSPGIRESNFLRFHISVSIMFGSQALI